MCLFRQEMLKNVQGKCTVLVLEFARDLVYVFFLTVRYTVISKTFLFFLLFLFGFFFGGWLQKCFRLYSLYDNLTHNFCP